ncbi:PAS domain S-box protein [Texcoconibacillus texcoconensis]|uniref:histidine kinase n=1 Tax=Texcoconibacillus texcoconensis TaxID=1095777 RepID=A0A840QPP4_9BACI|nr:PAS domain S-box protein [Texcoconibacillus texcoconensis]MBB5173329.1 PAS domain S-box-containing protein [Texcoconibacillus texcoconensis]
MPDQLNKRTFSGSENIASEDIKKIGETSQIHHPFDYLSDVVVTLDQNGQCTYVNEAAVKLFDNPRQLIIGRDIRELCQQLACPKFNEAYERAMKNREKLEFDEYISSDQRWLKVCFLPSETNITLIVRDITDLRKVNDVIETNYRSMFDQHPDGVVSLDQNGRILRANHVFEELLSIDIRKYVGKHYHRIVRKRFIHRIDEMFLTAVQGEPRTEEFDVLLSNGQRLDVSLMMLPIISDEETIGVHCIVRDMSERNFVAEKARRLHDMNDLILDSVNDAILGIDVDFNVILWNDEAEKLTGFRQEELTHSRIMNVFTRLKKESRKQVEEVLSGVVEPSGQPIVKDERITLLRKEGCAFCAEVSVNPIITGEQFVGLVFTFRDITEKRKSEEMLHQSDKLSAVGQLAAGIAHEIRNPLTSLKGFLQLIESQSKGNKEYFDIMKAEFARIEQILTELLILSKPQSMIKETKSLSKLLEEIIALLETQAIMKNIEIQKMFEREDIDIICTEYQIKQVFVNFIKNAIEAMDEGGIITVELMVEGSYAVVRVRDEGNGIPAKVLERLGEPFFTTKENGTGLGLMVSYKIIEEHNGAIDVNSSEGMGTTFIVRLPLAM